MAASESIQLRRLPLTRETLALHVSEMPSGCWHWKLKPMGDGYGRKQWGKKTMKAHRAVWETVNGPIPEGMKVCHTCDNRICVNPSHLFLGTTMDNWNDCRAKGRNYRGERVVQAKLDASKVKEIRRLYASRIENIPSLARQFGVAVGTIGKVINRKLWRHVA